MAVLKVVTEISPTYKKNGITKKYHDNDTIPDIIHYIFDPRKTLGKYIGGLAINLSWAAEQMTAVADAYGKNRGIRVRHMVLSFDVSEHVTPEQAMIIAYETALWYANDYQILFAVHIDSDNLHIHFVMNTVSYLNGRKYEGKKWDYYHFQVYLKRILGGYGFRLNVASDRK